MTDLLHQIFLPGGILFLPFIVGCMGSVTFGVVGSYVTVRGATYVAASIAHSALAGIGAAVFARHHFGWEWCNPLYGAFIAAMLSAFLIGKVTLRAEHLGDRVISAVMVLGMSIGLILLHLTPGYYDPMSVLFGDILLVSSRDIALLVMVNALILVCGTLPYRKLLAVCFDEEYARLRGLRADSYYILLLLLTALTVVAMMQLVGIVMVIALLTLPATSALLFTRKLWHCMIASTCFCAVFITGGLALSFQTDLPTGPVIVILAGVFFLLAAGIRQLKQKRNK